MTTLLASINSGSIVSKHSDGTGKYYCFRVHEQANLVLRYIQTMNSTRKRLPVNPLPRFPQPRLNATAHAKHVVRPCRYNLHALLPQSWEKHSLMPPSTARTMVITHPLTRTHPCTMNELSPDPIFQLLYPQSRGRTPVLPKPRHCAQLDPHDIHTATTRLVHISHELDSAA